MSNEGKQTTAWDGHPENRERDGWHWLRLTGKDNPEVMFWDAEYGWVDKPDDTPGQAAYIAEYYAYLGPCLTPSEVSARESAAELRGLEAGLHRADRFEEALHRIVQWADAYPLGIFPEPDFKRAHEVLTAAGMTLDAISASCMRHVVKGAGDIARAALKIREG